ncbi:MAG: DUF4476 domain-containing protein [Flavobacteriales bacterium]|nr:DUF4476 domain-containing protein [Flavobacteriales bacterium]
MKKNYLVILVALGVSIKAFTQNCTTPMSNSMFQQRLNQINGTFDATYRYTQARNLAQGNCLNTWQVKQVALALNSDYDKLEFCKIAFANTTDKDNFYDVYDAFAFFSTVFRLHDFVTQARQQMLQPITPNVPVYTGSNTAIIQNNMIVYPPLPYPEVNGYIGITQCNMPVSDAAVNGHVQHMLVSNLPAQGRLDYIRTVMNTNCFTTAQIMRLATVFSMETYRLEVIKYGIQRVYDKGNYEYAKFVLTSQPLINDFLNALFETQVITSPVVVQPTCTVSNADYNQVKSSIEKERFANTKVSVAKQAFQAKKCFTVEQIIGILQLFAFEDNKLDLAKFAYDYCIDKENYYRVNDVFTFSASKDELNRFLQGRR